MSQTTEIVKNLIVTRVFEAPVHEVWKAWTESSYVRQWWGPRQFTTPMANMEVKPGGKSLVCMRSPDGHDIYNTWTYKTIVPDERLEFTLNFSDKDGNKLSPSKIGMPPGIPDDVPHVIIFKALDDNRTEMTMMEYGYTSEEVVNLSKMGLDQSLDKMAYLFAKQTADGKSQ
jgi:uncharacterized protein YndB with AHSA1/START domain